MREFVNCCGCSLLRITFTCTPSECSLVTEPKPVSFLLFAPRRGVFPHAINSQARNQKKRMALLTLAHGAATTKRGRGLPEKRLRQLACRTLSIGKYSSERDVPQLTQKLRAYNRVRTPRNAFDGRNCTVGEFFPRLRVFKVLNAGGVCNPTPLLSTLWKSARLKRSLQRDYSRLPRTNQFVCQTPPANLACD